jgi:hypothetical protein
MGTTRRPASGRPNFYIMMHCLAAPMKESLNLSLTWPPQPPKGGFMDTLGNPKPKILTKNLTGTLTNLTLTSKPKPDRPFSDMSRPGWAEVGRPHYFSIPLSSNKRTKVDHVFHGQTIPFPLFSSFLQTVLPYLKASLLPSLF